MTELRALTWKEPFATLMLWGKIETRPWPTSYRGRVLICAGKQPYKIPELELICGSQYNRLRQALYEAKAEIGPLLGHAIAVGRLIDCRPMKKQDEKACFVQYKPGLYCHVYDPVVQILPYPFKGQQGWKKLPPDFLTTQPKPVI